MHERLSRQDFENRATRILFIAFTEAAHDAPNTQHLESFELGYDVIAFHQLIQLSGSPALVLELFGAKGFE